LTDDAIREMSRHQQSIGLHSHQHRRMDRLSDSEIREQMRISQERIQQLTGSPPTLFAPPGGFITPQVRAIALESSVRLIRTMRWGYNRNPDLTNLQCVPVNSRTTEKHFRRIMQFRSLNLTYTLKQTAKKLLPSTLYQTLRDKLYSRGHL